MLIMSIGNEAKGPLMSTVTHKQNIYKQNIKERKWGRNVSYVESMEKHALR